MTKAKVLLAVSFLITLAAGVAVGLMISRVAHRPPGPSWLAAELDLTGEQREQMHQIWSEVMQAEGQRQWEQRRVLTQERDEAIAALMSETQRAQYDQILQEHSRKMTELSQERKRAFEEAVEKTKQILTPEQAEKYDELLKKQRERGPGEGGGPPSPWGKGRRPRPGPPDEPPPKDQGAPHGGGDPRE